MPLNLLTPPAKLPGSFEPLGPASITAAAPNPAAAVTPIAGAGGSGGPQLGTHGNGTEGTPVDAPATLPDFSTSRAQGSGPAAGTPVDAPATVPDFSGEISAEPADSQRGGWSTRLLDRIARPAEDSTAQTPAEAAADSRKAQQAA